MISVSFEVQLPLPSGGLCSDDADVEVPENTTVAEALAQVRKQFDINPSFSYIIAKLSYTASGTYLPMQIKETRLVRRNENYIVTFSSDTPITPLIKTPSPTVIPTLQISPILCAPSPMTIDLMTWVPPVPSQPPVMPSPTTFQQLLDAAVTSANALSNSAKLVRTPGGKTKCSLLTVDSWYESNSQYIDNAYELIRPKAPFPFSSIDPYIFCNSTRGKATMVLLANSATFHEAQEMLRVAKSEGQRIMRDMVIAQFPNRDYKFSDGKRLGEFFRVWTGDRYFADIAINHRSRLFCTLRQKNFRDKKRGIIKPRKFNRKHAGETSWDEMSAFLAANDAIVASASSLITDNQHFEAEDADVTEESEQNDDNNLVIKTEPTEPRNGNDENVTESAVANTLSMCFPE